MSRIVILHNEHDKTSREFVKAARKAFPNLEVVDWYDERSRSSYLNSGGSMQVSAFPSIVVFPKKGKLIPETSTIRLPQDLSALEAAIAGAK